MYSPLTCLDAIPPYLHIGTIIISMNAIDQAFSEIKRTGFLPDQSKHMASHDAPVPIGHGQTNSQPSTVRRMLEWLDAQPGDRALDIGSGSGWTTALLSVLVRPGGRVFAVEKIPELRAFGEANCKKAGIKNVRFFLAAKRYGLPQYGPYERILVSASAREFPDELTGQLKPGGKLVVPVQDAILEITKTSATSYDKFEHPGFVFVPLV